ncbi:PAS domain S-box protein [Methanoculleus frigidifontis]|nr:PAS domain S-box protein [Methanoculleus sp. FWC-SCC1]
MFALLQGAEEATCIATPEMEVLWINPAMERLAGIAAADARGRDALRFVAERVLPQADEPCTAAITSAIRNRTEEHGIACRITEPAGEAWYAYTSRRVENGTLKGAWILQFREITEQKRSEREHGRCSDEIAFLSGAATALAALPTDADVFAVIGRYLHEIVPEAIVIVSEADIPAGTLTPRAFFGMDDCLPEIAALLGRNLTGITLNLPENIREIMARGEIEEIEGGLEAAALWQIPTGVCRRIEEFSGLGAMYCVPFTWQEEIFGTAVILTRREGTPVPFEAVDTFKNLAAIALQRNRAEETLRRGEETFRALIEKSSDFILVLDDRMTIRFASPPIERIDGFPPETLIGKSAFAMMQPEEVPRAREVLSALMQRPGGSMPLEVSFSGPRGTHVIEAMITNLLDDPQIRGIVVNARDITERKQAEEALQKAERDKALILNSTAEMFAYYDTDLRVLWVNRAAVAVIGREPEDVVGHLCYEIWHNRREVCEGCPVVLARETKTPHETEITTPDGRVFFLRGYPVLDEEGELVGLIEFAQDITEQKQAEEALRAAGAYNRSLIEANPDPLVAIGPDGRITDVNTASEQATGYARDELIGTDFSDYFTDPAEARAGYRRVFAEGQVRDYPLEIRHRDGHTMPVLYNATVYRDGEGNVAGVFAAARDITERKAMEEALRESEERYRLFLQNFQGIAFRANLDFSPVFCYGAAEAITGYTEEELFSDPGRWYRMIHPDDSPSLAETSEKLRSVPGYATEREYRIVRKDGDVRWIREMIQNVTDGAGTPIHVQGAIYDITEQKQVEQELRESEERFRRIFEESGVGILLVSQDGVILRSNPAFQQMLGYREDELAGMNIREITYPEDLPATLALYERMAEGGGGREKLEKRYITRDGRIIWGRKTVTYLRSPEGTPLSAISVVEDITGRKAMEAALQESEVRFRSIFEESPIGIGYYNADGRLIDINPAALRIFGVPDKGDVKGANLFADPNIPEEERSRLKQGEAVHYTAEFDFDLVTARGLYRTSQSGRRYLDVLVTGIRRAGESRPDGYITLISDITDRVHEENLRQKAYAQIEQNIEQFAILGDHVRQPLQVILGIVDLESNGRKEIEIIRSQVRRINEIVKQLDQGWIESREIREFLRRHELV